MRLPSAVSKSSAVRECGKAGGSNRRAQGSFTQKLFGFAGQKARLKSYFSYCNLAGHVVKVDQIQSGPPDCIDFVAQQHIGYEFRIRTLMIYKQQNPVCISKCGRGPRRKQSYCGFPVVIGG